MSISRRRFIQTSLAAGLFPYAVTSRAANNCKPGSMILVGGVTGFDSLGKEENSRLLRATCRAALYVHGYIWTRSSEAERKAVLAAFANAPMEVELGLVNNPAAWFEKAYQAKYRNEGVRAQRAHVNGFNAKRMDIWREFVKTAKSYGIKTVSPIFSPNSQQYSQAEFKASKWDFLRQGARLGGGLTTDAPPHYFLAQPEAYRDFVVDELAWANAEGLHSAFIVSPDRSGPRFLQETQRTVEFLAKRKALPKAWIVENYNSKAKATYVNRIGTENESNSILGVALWLAQVAS